MSYVNKQTLKSLLNRAHEEVFDKKTIDFVFRSILEALVEEKAKSVVFLRVLNLDGLEGIIKRLNFLENCLVCNYDYIKTGDFGEVEFVMVSSSRFNAVLVWDYSSDENKNKSKIFFSMNSVIVAEVAKLLKGKVDDNEYEKFISHRPERRENTILNLAILKIISKLNENVVENTFTFKEMNKQEINSDLLREKFHEIKNQLSIIDIQTDILSKKGAPTNNINIIKKALSNTLDTMNNMKNKKEAPSKQIILKDLLDDVESLSYGFLSNKNMVKIVNKSKKEYVIGDIKTLNEVILNVIKNANESTKNDEIKLTAESDDDFCSLIIENHGDEIQEENKEKIFDENFTTKKKGWGIGLYACKKYMENQNGEIRLLKSDENSTQFLIKIPCL